MSRLLPPLLFLAGAALAAVGMKSGLGWHDEGLMLQWGSRIGAGEVPYRDFWMNYLPGQAVVQALPGPDLMSWRILRALVGAAGALFVFLLVRQESGERWALAAWLAAALAFAWPLSPGPTATALMLALAALLVQRSVGSGLLAGLAMVFRPELGLAGLAAVLYDRRGRRDDQVRIAGTAALVVFSLLLPVLVLAGGDFAEQVVGFVGIQDLQRLPLVLDPGTTDPNKVIERLHPVLLLAAAIATVLGTRAGWRWLPLLLVGAAYLLARADEFHLLPLAVAVVVAAGAAAASERSVHRAVAASVIGLVALTGAVRLGGQVVDDRRSDRQALAGGDGVRVSSAEAAAIGRLRSITEEMTAPGDPVLVLPPRLDRVRVGAPLLYVLLERSNPTRYDVMQPGVVTTATVQREIVADMARTRPELVFRWESPVAFGKEGNDSDRSSGVRLVDEAVARDYRPLMRAGDWLVLSRR